MSPALFFYTLKNQQMNLTPYHKVNSRKADATSSQNK